jgi:seryl-tRNA synthetase
MSDAPPTKRGVAVCTEVNVIDLKLIRENPEAVKTAIATLNATAPIDEIVALDLRRRAMLTEVEALKAERNEGSKIVNRTKDTAERQSLIENLRALGDSIAALDEQTKQVDTELNNLMLQVPNLPLPDVPVGPDESHNVVTRTVGEPRTFDFEPKPHWEIAEALGIIDFERGVKISGSRFYVLRGDGARLQRALIAWMLDLHTEKHGYQEVYPPFMVLEEMLVGTGNLPKFGDALFRIAHDDKWLIPTAEVPVTNLYRDEILDEEQLPIYHVAYTPCFRNEKMSAGRDVRGIKRGYQFDKVEMVKFVHPEKSAEEHGRLIGEASDVLEALGLPYRELQMCTGDLSFSAANKVDMETWAPGSNEWLEVSSCSNFMDFQARRANLRFRPAGGGRPQFLHTLNGSALALPRTIISIIENYQREDGSFDVPEVLQPYMKGQKVVGMQPPIGAGKRT